MTNNKPFSFIKLQSVIISIWNKDKIILDIIKLIQPFQEMEYYGLVNRKQYMEILPRVEYSLTEAGKDLIPALESLAKWGKQMKNMQMYKWNKRLHLINLLSFFVEQLRVIIYPIYVWFNPNLSKLLRTNLS